MSFEMEKYFFKLMNNSVYGKTIKKKISLRSVNNAKNIRHIKRSFGDEKGPKRLFQEPPFYNVPNKEPYIKRINNIDLLHKLPC